MATHRQTIKAGTVALALQLRRAIRGSDFSLPCRPGVVYCLLGKRAVWGSSSLQPFHFQTVKYRPGVAGAEIRFQQTARPGGSGQLSPAKPISWPPCRDRRRSAAAIGTLRGGARRGSSMDADGQCCRAGLGAP